MVVVAGVFLQAVLSVETVIKGNGTYDVWTAEVLCGTSDFETTKNTDDFWSLLFQKKGRGQNEERKVVIISLPSLMTDGEWTGDILRTRPYVNTAAAELDSNNKIFLISQPKPEMRSQIRFACSGIIMITYV